MADFSMSSENRFFFFGCFCFSVHFYFATEVFFVVVDVEKHKTVLTIRIMNIKCKFIPVIP